MTGGREVGEQVVAIIGGTGLYRVGDTVGEERLETPYGPAIYARTAMQGRTVLFLARHGADHATPPHRVNYRANIWALHALGARHVLATHAVGGINPVMAPGHFVAPSQFIDWTKGRPSTFIEGEHGRVAHVDVTHPYCRRLIACLLRADTAIGERIHADAVYACMEGPRFETAAEIRALRTLGADIVGMTSVPEVVLAREAGLCYAAICLVCNWAAGIVDAPLTQEEVVAMMAKRAAALRGIIAHFVAHCGEGRCACEESGFGHCLPAGPMKEANR